MAHHHTAVYRSMRSRGVLQPVDPKPPMKNISYYQWKADELNRLFLEHGVMHQPARITAATVAHGMAAEIKRAPNARGAQILLVP